MISFQLKEQSYYLQALSHYRYNNYYAFFKLKMQCTCHDYTTLMIHNLRFVKVNLVQLGSKR